MGRSYTKVILVVLALLAVALPAPGGGGEYRFQGRADWELWTYPSGTVVLNEDGSIGLRRYRKNINAAANASEFERASKDAKGMVPGGIRYAPSNQGDGRSGYRRRSGDVVASFRGRRTGGLVAGGRPGQVGAGHQDSDRLSRFGRR